MALPKVINILRFNVDSTSCPQELRLILRENIRDVFKRRTDYARNTLSNHGIDALLDLWWSNHQNIIRAASIRPEWDWKSLSLVFDQNVSRPVNFRCAYDDYRTLLGLVDNARVFTSIVTDEVDYNNCGSMYGTTNNMLGRAADLLFSVYVKAFEQVVLEGQPVKDDYTDEDAKISLDMANRIVEFINSKSHPFEKEGKLMPGCFFTNADVYSLLDSEEPISFNKLPKTIYEKVKALPNENRGHFINDVLDVIVRYEDEFIADLFKSVGAHQISNNLGAVKTTIVNKLVKSYFDWITALTVCTKGNPFKDDDTFDVAVSRMKIGRSYYSSSQFKIRNTDGEGYSLSNHGSFEQLFARLQENVKGSFSKESFIISFHPCDMITCSLGYNWSSCQSWINDFHDLPAAYGQGSNHGGAYNRGNFQFLCANGFIAYIPYEKLPDVPQYLWAKKKRCLLWVGNNLDCMRQNDFYPGHPKDAESIALAKVMREYIQDICAPFNFSNGTVDWKVKKNLKNNYYMDYDEDASGVDDFEKFTQEYCPNNGRYDDPIAALSYLKTAVCNEKKPSLKYTVMFPRLDNGIPSSGQSPYYSFFSNPNTTHICPVCGKVVTTAGLCKHCASECIEHNGVKVHPSELVCINVEGKKKYFDINELDNLGNYVVTEDGVSIEFKSAVKVFMPSGIKYFKTLPDYAVKCSVCGEYFHKSLMIGDVCIHHFNSAIANRGAEIKYDIKDIIDLFVSGSISFDCNDTAKLTRLLALLGERNIKWVSGCVANSYVPSSNGTKKLYLSYSRKGLLLSAQAKSTVIKISNLVEKGGE